MVHCTRVISLQSLCHGRLQTEQLIFFNRRKRQGYKGIQIPVKGICKIKPCNHLFTIQDSPCALLQLQPCLHLKVIFTAITSSNLYTVFSPKYASLKEKNHINCCENIKQHVDCLLENLAEIVHWFYWNYVYWNMTTK